MCVCTHATTHVRREESAPGASTDPNSLSASVPQTQRMWQDGVGAIRMAVVLTMFSLRFRGQALRTAYPVAMTQRPRQRSALFPSTWRGRALCRRPCRHVASRAPSSAPRNQCPQAQAPRPARATWRAHARPAAKRCQSVAQDRLECQRCTAAFMAG